MKIAYILLIQIFVLLLIGFYIVSEIQKHSVHPIYGNYEPKVDKFGLTCEPWDSCKQTPKN